MSFSFASVWPYAVRGWRFSWDVFLRTVTKFIETDAEQRAASFAYYAFFSLFPLIILLVSIGTMFLGDEEKSAKLIAEIVASYLPVQTGPAPAPVVSPSTGGIMMTAASQGPGQGNWFVAVVEGVVHSRRKAGLVAFALLGFSSLRFFQALVRGVNKAWGTKEYSWWRLPIKNLFMVAIVASALFLGVFTPAALELSERTWRNLHLDYRPLETIFQFSREIGLTIFWFSRQIVPTLVLFYGFAMFYRFAPRRRTTFRQIWSAAVLVTLGLQALQYLFLFYAHSLSDFNRLYGALSSVVALLVWIYLSGALIIFGGCLSAALYEVNMHITDQSESSVARP